MAGTPMTRSDLYAHLDGWDVGAPVTNEAVSREVWDRAGRTRAVLVSDMSGFTRLTRSHGILHFLALFQRAHRIGEEAFARHGGRHFKTAADNLFALFDRAGDAAACARAMLAAADALNARVPSPDAHVRLCIGIGFGRILELADDAFGDPVNVAFKLGEDVAGAGEILLSDEAAGDLRAAADHAALAAALEGPLEEDLGHVPVRYWRLAAG